MYSASAWRARPSRKRRNKAVAPVTGDIDDHYLDAVEGKRGGKGSKNDDDGDGKASQQLVLQLAADAQD